MAVHPSGCRVNSTCVSSLTLELRDKISPRDVSAARLEAGGKEESREARESRVAAEGRATRPAEEEWFIDRTEY